MPGTGACSDDLTYNLYTSVNTGQPIMADMSLLSMPTLHLSSAARRLQTYHYAAEVSLPD